MPDPEPTESEIDQLLVDYHRRHYTKVTSPRFDIVAAQRHSAQLQAAAGQLKQVEDLVPLQPDWKILDIGSGFGYFVAQCRQRGLNAFGAEIDSEKLAIGKKVFSRQLPYDQIIRSSQPREIPFDSDQFDLATMFFVMEHVEDVPALLRDIRRVLKPGGLVYLICPNFVFPYETHYALPLPTFLPKSICALWLRCAGRDSNFLMNCLNLKVRPGYLEQQFRAHGFSFNAAGLQQWNQTIDGHALETRSLELRQIVRCLTALHLGGLAKKLAHWGFYAPLVYVLKKS